MTITDKSFDKVCFVTNLRSGSRALLSSSHLLWHYSQLYLDGDFGHLGIEYIALIISNNWIWFKSDPLLRNSRVQEIIIYFVTLVLKPLSCYGQLIWNLHIDTPWVSPELSMYTHTFGFFGKFATLKLHFHELCTLLPNSFL